MPDGKDLRAFVSGAALLLLHYLPVRPLGGVQSIPHSKDVTGAESGLRAVAQRAADQQLHHHMFLAKEATDPLVMDIWKHLEGAGDRRGPQTVCQSVCREAESLPLLSRRKRRLSAPELRRHHVGSTRPETDP